MINQETLRPTEQKASPSLHTQQSEDAPQANKDPLTRLLDLMLGWAEYTERDEAEHGDKVQSSDIYEAYSSVAEFAEPYWDAPRQVQEMAVHHFMDTRILPLLLGKTKP